MRALCLLGVFLVAKGGVLAGRDLPLTLWAPVAYLWQDLLAVLVFGVVDARLRRPRVAWAAYGAVAVYAAVNVPVARTLSTPLTWPLLRAARGPLADSILLYFSWTNALWVLLVLGGAALFPVILRRLPMRAIAVAGAVVLPALVVLGPAATVHIDTLGLHRNVLAALLMTAFPRVASEGDLGSPRTSPYAGAPAEDLAEFRGAAAGRSVVLVALESTAAQYLRPYGAAEDPMPHLSSLADQSILFENAYATYPESIKGLFSVLCSAYPAIDTAPEVYAQVRPPALAAVLAPAGYHTGLFHSGRFGYLGMEAVVRDRGFHTLEDAGAIGGDHQSSFGLDDERQAVRRILAWIDSVPKGERFFVHYLPIAGHHPYATPEPGPFPTAEAIDRYRNALHHADAAIGELLGGLAQRGLDRKTLLIFYGDHGEAFGQHEGNFAHTLFIYNENVHVPLLIAAPGVVREGRRTHRVASLVDLAPTVLDLLGLPAPEAYQGRSLLDGPPLLTLFFTDYSQALVGLCDGRWKFILDLDTRRSKLFDLAQDRREKRDLSAQFPERVQVYEERLLRWTAAQRKRIIGWP